MATTQRQPASFGQLAVPANVHRFAALPRWLIDATQPASVASALARSIPECAAGAVMIIDRL